MKKTKTAKTFAIFALLGIIISIVGTWILVLTTPTHEYGGNEPALTPDALNEIISNSKVEISNEVWEDVSDKIKVETDTTELWTWTVQ